MRSKTTLGAFWAFLVPLCLAASCDQLSNPYQGPDDTQFEVTCNAYSLGGNQIGPTIEVTDLESCIELCATTSGCKAALFDRSQYLCYTLDESDGPVSNSLYDMAVLLPSGASSTAISPTTSPTTTSPVSAPTPCDQLDNPSYIDGVKLTIFCGKQATGGNQVDYSNQLRSFTECMTFCVDTLACRAVTFDSNFNDCYLFDGFNGFMSQFGNDMAIASRPAISSTTEAPAELSTTTSLSTTSTTAPSGPLPCEEMAGSVYTGPNENKFTISCGTSSTGEYIYRRDEEDSMQGCVDRCDRESRCIAVNFLPSPYYECDLIESFAGTKSSPSTNFASKIPSSASTSASSATSSTLQTGSLASTSSRSPETTSTLLPPTLTSDTTSAGTLELLSFTTTSAVSSETAILLSTTLSSSESLSLSQDAPPRTTSESALLFTLESTSATTSLATSSSLTELSASILSETSSPLSSESASDSTSDGRLESASASPEPTTIATSAISLHTVTTTVQMSATETLHTKTLSAITTSISSIQSSATELTSSDISRVSTETQSTSVASALPSTSSTPARNIPVLGEYTFTGCLKSLESYPSFQEVANTPDMTPGKCIDLATGSNYIGVYQETCYKADVLDDTEFILDASCDLACPGDFTLFCGGILRSKPRLLHRAIAPNRLLTLYSKAASSSSDSTSSAPTASSASSLQTTGVQTDEMSSELISTSLCSQLDSSWSLSFLTSKSAGSKTLATTHSMIAETTSESRLPASIPTTTAFHTAYSTLTNGHAYTKSRFAETVTTVTYTTINPTNPAALTTTCALITLLYSPCGCEHQVYPTVDMTAVACTHQGGIITLTVPKAACETGAVSHTHPIVQYPSGWVGGHEKDAGSNTHPAKRPTTRPQPGSKNSQPESPTVATGFKDAHASYKIHRPVNPTSAAGSNGVDQPERGIPQPSVAAQGSPESNRNTPTSPSQLSSPKKLTTDTSIIPTPPLDTPILPSKSLLPGQSQVPSRSKGVSYTTPLVVSEAYRTDVSLWVKMTAILAVFLLL